jgi:hypothetical protein
MHQGLIANWHRGVAAKGFIGALLVTIPVVVAATIGIGGVGDGGLSSLATGPSEKAAGQRQVAVDTHSLEKLTASTLPELTISPRVERRTSSAPTRDGGVGSTEAPTFGGTAPSTDVEGGAGKPDGGGVGAGTPAVDTGPVGTTPPATDPGSTGSMNGISIQVNNTLNQLLQSFGLGK